jgi:hypothetical protein
MQESTKSSTNVCACGLKSGEYIALIKPLEVRDHTGKVTCMIPADSPWEVVGPEPEDGIVWLVDPNGKRHTWDDVADDIFSYFRRVERYECAAQDVARS